MQPVCQVAASPVSTQDSLEDYPPCSSGEITSGVPELPPSRLNMPVGARAG